MMKIGILTQMHGYNYGGVLQCYALQEALKKLEHDVCVIDCHHNPNWRKLRRLCNFAGPKIGKKIINRICMKYAGAQVFKSIEAFRESYLQMSKLCDSHSELVNFSRQLDAIVVGSDQIWNLDWYTPEYFLDFTKGISIKKISYAACFGHPNQDFSQIAELPALLNSFDYISVRNDVSQKLVKKICGRDSVITADPTLLIDMDHLMKLPELPFENYIMLYAVDKDRLGRYEKYLERIKLSLQLPVVAIKSDVLQSWEINIADYLMKNPRVEEWVGLIAKASYVMTDSFHGTVFSLKYKRPFISYIGNAPSSVRVAFVADKYDVKDGYPISDIEFENTRGFCGDFNLVEEKIDEHVRQSYEFLKQIG